MAYNNFYPQYYPQVPVYNPHQIVKVNGRNGAETYQMPPNSSCLLLDESAPIVWLAQSDGAGYKTLTAYDIQPHKEVAPVDTKSLEERITKLEGIVNESYNTNAKQWRNEQTKSNASNGANNQVSK